MYSADAITAEYQAFYQAHNPAQTYPAEFGLRAYRDNYPRLKRDSSGYAGKSVPDLGDGHKRISNDPYGVRNGYILKTFRDESDIVGAMSPTFKSFSIGACRNDFWGIEERVWIVVCKLGST